MYINWKLKNPQKCLLVNANFDFFYFYLLSIHESSIFCLINIYTTRLTMHVQQDLFRQWRMKEFSPLKNFPLLTGDSFHLYYERQLTFIINLYTLSWPSPPITLASQFTASFCPFLEDLVLTRYKIRKIVSKWNTT